MAIRFFAKLGDEFEGAAESFDVTAKRRDLALCSPHDRQQSGWTGTFSMSLALLVARSANRRGRERRASVSAESNIEF
jgi:hypothetical protein